MKPLPNLWELHRSIPGLLEPLLCWLARWTRQAWLWAYNRQERMSGLDRQALRAMGVES